MGEASRSGSSWDGTVRATWRGFHLCVLPDYVSFIRLLTDGSFSSGDYIFRGQSGPDMNLIPSLSRLTSHLSLDERRKIREEHKRNFIKFARGRIHDPLANPLAIHMGRDGLELLGSESDEMIWALGQHYGLRTPLLDWTSKALIALFFAFDGGGAASRTRRHRVVYALNTRLVELLNEKTRQINDPTPNAAERSNRVDYPTLSLIPATKWHNSRLSAQHGLFTYCTQDMTVEDWVMFAVDKTCSSKTDPVLIKFLIEEGDPRDCLRYLDDAAGINTHALFPDIGGTAQYCAKMVEGLIVAESDRDLRVDGSAGSIPASSFGRQLQNLRRGDTVTLVDIQNTTKRYTLESHLSRPTGWSLILVDDLKRRYFVKVPMSDGESDIKSVEEHVRKENALLARLKGIDGVPADSEVVFVKELVDDDELQPRLHPALMNSYIQGVRLDELPSSIVGGGDHSSGDRRKWFIDFALRLTRILRAIHGRLVVHLSILPRYIVFKDCPTGATGFPPAECAHLVGFGYAKSWAEPGELRLPTRDDVRYRAPEARCDRYDLGGSSFHSDVYSLGALLFGIAATSGEPGRGDSEAIMRSTEWTLWMSGADFLKSILCKCVNEMPDDRYATVEQMIQDLETALKIEERRGELPALKRSTRRIKDLKEVLSLGKNSSGEVSGARDDLIKFVSSIFVRLPPGSSYRTRTHARYWTARNLGVYGRLFALNKDLLGMGMANIHRLFLTSDTFLQMPHEEQEVFMRHSLARNQAGLLVPTKVHFLDKPNKVIDFERFSEHVAVVQYGEQHIGISFISRGNVVNAHDRVRLAGEIVKARWRVLSEREGETWISEFDKEFHHGETIQRFISGDQCTHPFAFRNLVKPKE